MKEEKLTTLSLILSTIGMLGVIFGWVTKSHDETLSWGAPTQNEDGSPLTNLRDYKVYIGTQQGASNYAISSTTNTNLPISPPSGNYFARVTAFNTLGMESKPSNELAFQVVGTITPQPSNTPTTTPFTPSPTRTASPTVTPTYTATNTRTATSTSTRSPIPTIMASPTKTPTKTPTKAVASTNLRVGNKIYKITLQEL